MALDRFKTPKKSSQNTKCSNWKFNFATNLEIHPRYCALNHMSHDDSINEKTVYEFSRRIKDNAIKFNQIVFISNELTWTSIKSDLFAPHYSNYCVAIKTILRTLSQITHSSVSTCHCRVLGKLDPTYCPFGS